MGGVRQAEPVYGHPEADGEVAGGGKRGRSEGGSGV